MNLKQFLIALTALLAFSATAGVKDDFKQNIRRSANNYFAYPIVDDSEAPTLTDTPQGYTPFFINHYGRHGSRWLIGKRLYNFPVEQLEIGERNGKLTPRGREVLDILRRLRADAHLRDGELSDIGAEQHQGIARRMFHNFPEVFAANAHVRARSTVVIRCILSMQNELDILKSLNPNLQITSDASQAEMFYMNYDDPDVGPLRSAALPQTEQLRDKLVKPEKMLAKLFTDKRFARDSIKGTELMIDLFDVVGNMQSHHAWEHVDLYDLFTLDEAYNVWRYNNMRWYVFSGETPLTRGRVNYMQANLLTSFIHDADQAIARGGNSASLRFGHESVVLPLVCLMGINGADYQTTDLLNLDRYWQSYKIFPMACNLQMIFYRSNTDPDDILVKVLLNETEATLPVATDRAPYYHWTDIRQYFLDKLSRKPYIQSIIQ